MLLRAAVLLTIVASVQTAFGALTAAQVVVNINSVATISSSANAALVPLSIKPTLTQAKTIAVNLGNAFNTIITDLTVDVTAMASTPPFSDVDAGLIVNALDNFIAIHQTLLGTVIGKQTIFAQFALTAPIAAVLRGLEGAVDSFANGLIILIPTKATVANSNIFQLDQTLGIAINTYQQICIPSVAYPAIPPTCVSL